MSQMGRTPRSYQQVDGLVMDFFSLSELSSPTGQKYEDIFNKNFS